MTANRDLENRLAAYYESERPFRAPDRVLLDTVAAIDDIPQRRVLRRVPWRFPNMSNIVRMAAAAIAVIAVVAIGWAVYSNNQSGIGVQPSASPTAVPSAAPTASPPPTLSETFTSEFFGMSIGHPAGWTVTSSAGPWITSLPGVDDTRDTISALTAESLFIGLASQPLAGRTAEEWIAEIADDPEWGASCDTAETEPISVDGASGILAYCPERPLHALVADASRGYFIVLYGSDDRAWFDDILATVQLDPGSAVDQ
jgi:hypothetical protein